MTSITFSKRVSSKRAYFFFKRAGNYFLYILPILILHKKEMSLKKGEVNLGVCIIILISTKEGEETDLYFNCVDLNYGSSL
jgi:hypothetical protein